MGAACSNCGAKKIHTGFKWENPKKQTAWKNVGVHAGIILKWIKWDAPMLECGLDSPVASCCEHGNEHLFLTAVSYTTYYTIDMYYSQFIYDYMFRL
jgi:hypothetical protein